MAFRLIFSTMSLSDICHFAKLCSTLVSVFPTPKWSWASECGFNTSPNWALGSLDLLLDAKR